MANDKNSGSIDDLLDETLDDLADLPEFKPFPPGAHHCKSYWSLKTINDKSNFELKLVLVETKELANPNEDTAPNPGSECTALFSRENEIGQGKFKKLIAPTAERLNTASIKETLKAMEGADVLVVSKVRANKKEPDQVYMDIVSIEVL